MLFYSDNVSYAFVGVKDKVRSEHVHSAGSTSQIIPIVQTVIFTNFAYAKV